MNLMTRILRGTAKFTPEQVRVTLVTIGSIKTLCKVCEHAVKQRGFNVPNDENEHCIECLKGQYRATYEDKEKCKCRPK